MEPNNTREERTGVWTLVSRPGSETVEENLERERNIREQEQADRELANELNRRNSFVNKPRGWR